MSAEQGFRPSEENGRMVKPGLLVREHAHPERRAVVTDLGEAGEPLFLVAPFEPAPDGGSFLVSTGGHSVVLADVIFEEAAPLPREEVMAAEARFLRERSAFPGPVVEELLADLPEMYGNWETSRFVRYAEWPQAS